MSNSSHTQKKKRNTRIKRTIRKVKVYYTDEIIPIVNEKKEEFDPCPICAFDLYYNEDTTQRVALLDEDDKVEGWMCPQCSSMFTMQDELTKLGKNVTITKS